MAPVPAMDASTSVASPLTPSKKENAYSSHSAINEQIKPAKNHELSRINESSNDSQPDPKGSWRSWRRGDGLQPWENEIVRSSEVQRKANVAQLYFLNHYFDNLRYLADRKTRHTRFQESTRARGLLPEGPDAEPSAEYLKERNSYFGRERVLLRKRRTKLRVDQFHIITQVGAGGYGEVFLARKRDTGEICALKRLKKRILVKMDEVRHVLTERDILTATKTPWLVRLLYAFQDPDHVFLAMEYVPGGDFRTLLCNNGALKEEYARFYMAEMLVSVNELHRLGYIHRDLKPENFLVDSTGHVKLTDFGLASGALSPGKIESMKARLDAVKDTDFVYRTPAERGSMYKKMIQHTQHRANSIVGSPDYIAPEMLRGRQYSFGVDYWSLGCILYEFLCGFPPFSGSNPDETFANLKNWQKVLQRPVYDTPENMQFNLSDVAWDAITKLVDTPERRYSSLEPVQAHPFFRSLDLGRLRELKAPFIPELESEEDTGYFDNFDDPADMARYKDVHEKQKNVEAVSERGSGAGGRAMWVGFTFGKNHLGANGKPLFPPSTSKDASDAFATMF